MPSKDTNANVSDQANDTQLTNYYSSVEKIPVNVYASSTEACNAVANEIAALIKEKAAKGEYAVLGLATGSTPVGVYEELVRLHCQQDLSFANVITFNLDEYWPMQPEELQSYNRFMHEHLFDHIDINPANIHIPDGTIKRDEIADYCQNYENAIRNAGCRVGGSGVGGGGIDYQILGIGRTGHIGFNEPGSPRNSKTRLITLDRVTRMDAASDFFGEWNVPRKAITMGVGTILDAKQISLLAFGEHKAQIIRQAVEGEISSAVSASYLQQHPHARIMVGHAAGAELTRIKTPWLLGAIESFGLTWDNATTRKAAIWLARKINKPILKLTDEDYNENGLQELLSARGSAYDINIEVFKSRQQTITGWPGGKPGRTKTDSTEIDIFPKRILVFSPHPDDDVISMGGTLIRLCQQGHEVHVAYQTSGNIAVFDDGAVRHADFVREFCESFNIFDQAEDQVQNINNTVQTFVKEKEPGEIDSPELQLIKTLIRRTEARAAARYSGVPNTNIHFLDLPFYETGRVTKKPVSEADFQITMSLLKKVKPHQIYAAGDLSDPHGTHRLCLNIICTAIKRLSQNVDDKQLDWIRNNCEIWLYRGAWQEWEPENIEMAVPLSPDELKRKRMAIFKHESQKDKALFPGPHDQREFWQRAEDRNRNTANIYNQLGLAEYEAIEGFVQWHISDKNTI